VLALLGIPTKFHYPISLLVLYLLPLHEGLAKVTMVTSTDGIGLSAPERGMIVEQRYLPA